MTVTEKLPWAKSRWPKLCAYLDSIGINPDLVHRNDLTAKSYRQYIVDLNGKPIMSKSGSTALTFERPWPSPEIGRKVMDLMAEDASDRRSPAGYPTSPPPHTFEREQEILAMTLEDMLREYRFAPIGRFATHEGDTDFFLKTFNARKNATTYEMWAAISKRVG